MEELKVNGETLAASQKDALVIEQYLSENYLFRRNVLNRKVEFVDIRVTTIDGKPVRKDHLCASPSASFSALFLSRSLQRQQQVR